MYLLWRCITRGFLVHNPEDICRHLEVLRLLRDLTQSCNYRVQRERWLNLLLTVIIVSRRVCAERNDAFIVLGTEAGNINLKTTGRFWGKRGV